MESTLSQRILTCVFATPEDRDIEALADVPPPAVHSNNTLEADASLHKIVTCVLQEAGYYFMDETHDTKLYGRLKNDGEAVLIRVQFPHGTFNPHRDLTKVTVGLTDSIYTQPIG